MSDANYTDIMKNGLWRQNSALVQLLGMCPVLAMSTSVINGFSLGIATAIVMSLSNGCSSAIRNIVPNEIRIPVFILIISVLVTVIEMVMNVYLHSLYLVLGIFIPLIITNCIVLARIEAFAAKNPVLPSMLDGLIMGVGLSLVLAFLGGMRELIGSGTLFSGLELIVDSAKNLNYHVMPKDYPGFLLAILPPGAFIGLGCLIAAKNYLDLRSAKHESQSGIYPQPHSA